MFDIGKYGNQFIKKFPAAIRFDFYAFKFWFLGFGECTLLPSLSLPNFQLYWPGLSR